MRIHTNPLRRPGILILLAAALFGAAPAARAQELVPRTGSLVAYQVGLPAGARITDNGGSLMARTDDVLISVTAGDLLDPANARGGLAEVEARRALTSRVMGSDSVLVAIIDQNLAAQNIRLGDRRTEVRTLGGERAMYAAGRTNLEGEPSWLGMYLTARDGVAYILIIVKVGEDEAEFQSFANRVHASFTLADAPPSVSRRSPGQ
jgi:hypothetical protein